MTATCRWGPSYTGSSDYSARSGPEITASRHFPAHGSYFDLQRNIRLNEGAENPFIDPAGYKSYVADREQAYRTELAKQKAALQPDPSR
jgi:hypothetical protein